MTPRNPMSGPTSAGDPSSDRTPLTPATLESLLVGVDHGEFVDFVADLQGKRGWAVDREGSVLTVTREGGERERLLVWTDDRNRLEQLLNAEPDAPGAGGVDAVVTRERDAETAREIADDRGAEVIDTAAIHDRLLYAVDRAGSRDLCETHFDHPVDPRPGPDPDATTETSASVFSSRAFMLGVVLLGLVVAGAAGVPAGPFGDAPNGMSGDVPGGNAGTAPVGANTATDAPTTHPTPTPPPTAGGAGNDPETETPDLLDCSDCPDLLAFEETGTVTANTTATINGTLHNAYGVELTDIAVELRTPEENWSVTPVEETTVEALPPGESRPVAWNLTVPPGDRGNYTVTAVVVSADEREALRIAGEYDFAIEPAGLRPPADAPCVEALGPLIEGGSCHLLTFDGDPPAVTAGETTTVTGTLYNPRDDPLVNGSVTLDPPTENWTVTPVSGTTFDRLAPGEVRRVAWNLTPPLLASGAHTVTSTTNYTRPGGPGRPNRTAPHSYRISVAPADVTQPPEAAPCRLDSGPVFPFGPCYLLTFPDAPAAVTAGETTTVTGQLYNARSYDITNGSVTLDPPTENWTVTPVSGTTFEELEAGEIQIARWNVTAPPSASGTVPLPGIINYTRQGGIGDENVSIEWTFRLEVSGNDTTSSGG
jgi:hypothetical protein